MNVFKRLSDSDSLFDPFNSPTGPTGQREKKKKKKKKLLDGIVRVASKLTDREMPSLESNNITRTQCKVRCITSDQHHPADHLLQCLPSERRFRTISMKTRTSRFKNSFYPKAVQIMSPVPSATTQ